MLSPRGFEAYTHTERLGQSSEPRVSCTCTCRRASTYRPQLLNEGFVRTDFGLLQRRNAGTNPCNKGKLGPSTHLVPRLESDVCVHSFLICREDRDEIGSLRGKKMNLPVKWVNNSSYSIPTSTCSITFPSYFSTHLNEYITVGDCWQCTQSKVGLGRTR